MTSPDITPHGTTAQTRHFVVFLGLRVWCWCMCCVCCVFRFVVCSVRVLGSVVCVFRVVSVVRGLVSVVVVYFCLCVSYRGVILYGDCVSCVCWGRVFCCGPRSMITYVVLMSSFHVALLSSCHVLCWWLSSCHVLCSWLSSCRGRHVGVV